MWPHALLDAALRALLALNAPPAPPPPAPVSDAALASQAEAAALAAEAAADDAGETILVTGDAPAESASSVHLGREVLRYRPRTQPSDLLRQVPGLQVSQHAGGGKSDQYFIRGFDADHGTDLAIFADGVPVNLTSHGHGQGYADTHWLIPETVESIDVHKGPYAARYGDFYTAGALELRTIDKIDAPTMWILAGGPLATSRRLERYDRRLVGMASPELRDGDATLVAAQVAEADGPFANPQDFRQGNALAKWRGAVGPGELRVATTWYAGRWNQSGQLPEREIAAGRLDRFGAIDPTEGGDASRASAQLGYTWRDGAHDATWRAMAYAVKNRLDLFSNFTLYARDPDAGDQIEQTDRRWMYGLDAAYERGFERGGVSGLITAGLQARADAVETSLWHTAQRARLPACFAEGANPCNHTRSWIGDLAGYAEAIVVPAPWLRVRPALRVDGFTWDVDDLDPETRGDAMTTTAGAARRVIASPKLSVELRADDQVQFFFNAGSGFHSNDARSAVRDDGHGALARAIGGEAGVRMTPHPRARVAMDAWYLHLASELVWSGDAGGTEPSDPTRRFGLDLEGVVDATPWLALDASITWAHATLVANQGNGGALALAPRWMGSGGATVHDARGYLAVRARGIADRPGSDDGGLTAPGYLIFDLLAGRKLGRWDLGLTVTNALDAAWREAQFAETSRVTPTAPVVEQMHFTPGAPLTATASVAITW